MMVFDLKLFLYLSVAFILATIIGTVSHECGHYIAARMLGWNAHLHYSSTSWMPGLTTTYQDYRFERFLIILAGPVQTMFTGSIGFLLLLSFRKYYLAAQKLTCKQWCIIFLSLFWLRQTFN